MIEDKKIFSLLGIARKGRKLVSGTEACKAAVYSHDAKLVIIAADTAKNTKKFFDDKCKNRKIPVIYFGERTELGRCIGKDERAVLAVLDDGIAEAIVKLYGILTRG